MKEITCRKCIHRDIHIASFTLMKTYDNGATYAPNFLSIYCKQKKAIVKYPYEKCNQRTIG